MCFRLPQTIAIPSITTHDLLKQEKLTTVDIHRAAALCWITTATYPSPAPVCHVVSPPNSRTVAHSSAGTLSMPGECYRLRQSIPNTVYGLSLGT
jgi:hypothetical protein